MARDRQRAKQRRARRAKKGGLPEPSKLEREDLPGGLEHASGEVDQFEAALVAGADGEQAPEGVTDAAGGADHPEVLSDAEFEVLEDRIDKVEEAFEHGDDREADALERELDEEASRSKPVAAAAATAGTATKRGPARFLAFLRASWSELQRVQWPDRRQVGQATAVVLGFVVVAGIYLGLADVVANQIVDLII